MGEGGGSVCTCVPDRSLSPLETEIITAITQSEWGYVGGRGEGGETQQAYLLRVGMRSILLTHWLSGMLQLQHLLVLISLRQTALSDMHLVKLVGSKKHC
jgi:hypothetical protein